VATLYDRLSPRQTEDSDDNEEDVLVAQPLSRKAKGSEGGEEGPLESYSTARTKGIARKVDEAEQRGRDYIRMPVSGSMRLVLEFLEGNGLAQYREMFVVNQIDHDELVKLTDVDLQEMGMSNASNRQRLLEQLRYISKARNACSNVATPLPTVWVGKHQGLDQKADRLLQNASGVLIHGYLMYLLAGSSKGWRRGYAVLQATKLHMFKSSEHVSSSAVFSWDVFGTVCAPSAEAENALSSQKEHFTITAAQSRRPQNELLLAGYDRTYLNDWQGCLVAASTSSAITRAVDVYGDAYKARMFSLSSFNLVSPSTWTADSLVEIIVTLKDAKGCSVLQYPHAVWMVSSSNAGSTLTGCGSDDQAKVHLTLGRALLEKAGHQSFLLIEFKTAKGVGRGEGESKKGREADVEMESLYWAIIDVAADGSKGQQRVDLLKRPVRHDLPRAHMSKIPVKKSSYVSFHVRMKPEAKVSCAHGISCATASSDFSLPTTTTAIPPDAALNSAKGRKRGGKGGASNSAEAAAIHLAQSVAPFVGDELQVCHESHQV
jgi:hypothetical protein